MMPKTHFLWLVRLQRCHQRELEISKLCFPSTLLFPLSVINSYEVNPIFKNRLSEENKKKRRIRGKIM